jgi:16S rRNA (cytidine1402-2'-O)-methyltransferase
VPLVLAGAPLGNPGDASSRLAAALAAADVVAAEDTRRLRRLCSDLGVTPTGSIVSCFEGNEERRIPELLDAVREGRTVLLVTDAGMPVVSDPGYRLVAAAAAEDLAITCLPGPSAVTTALALSGLPSDRFCFEGFLPRKGGERRTRLAQLIAERRTCVLFEAPHRLAASLADMAAVLGDDRRAVVCRELTKTYEEVRRGTLAELAAWAQGDVRGEITIVLAGAPEVVVDMTPSVLVALVAEREAAGLTRKDAVAQVALEAGVPKKDVYNAVVAAKHAQTGTAAKHAQTGTAAKHAQTGTAAEHAP